MNKLERNQGTDPLATPETSQSPPEQKQDTPLTLEAVQGIVGEAVETAVRRAQSHTDAVKTNVEKEIKRIEALTGSPLSDEAKGKVKDEVIKIEAEQKAPEDQTSTEPSPDTDPVTQKAINIMAKEGVFLDVNTDPEAKLVVTDQGEEVYLKSIQEQTLLKKQRLQAEGKGQIERTPTGVGATGSAVSDTFENKSRDEVWEQMWK